MHTDLCVEANARKLYQTWIEWPEFGPTYLLVESMPQHYRNKEEKLPFRRVLTMYEPYLLAELRDQFCHL